MKNRDIAFYDRQRSSVEKSRKKKIRYENLLCYNSVSSIHGVKTRILIVPAHWRVTWKTIKLDFLPHTAVNCKRVKITNEPHKIIKA